jgi:hypothetical protein
MDAAAPISYRRLPGRTPLFRFGGMSSPTTSLWLGPDHLLKVERAASRENYKRFFYRDIQAIMVEEASRWQTLTIFNGSVIAVIVIMTWAISLFSSAGLIVAGILCAPFVIGLLTNLALGPTTQGMLVTAVGTEALSSLSRLSRSTEALRMLAEEVTKVQGVVSFEQLLLKWPAAAATAPRP